MIGEVAKGVGPQAGFVSRRDGRRHSSAAASGLKVVLSSSDRGFTLSVVRMDAVFDLNRSSYLNLNNSFTAKTIF